MWNDIDRFTKIEQNGIKLVTTSDTFKSFPVAKVHVCSKSDGANTQMNRILDQYFANSGFKHSRLIRVEADTSELSTEHLPNKVRNSMY